MKKILFTFLIITLSISQPLFAGEPDYFKLPDNKQFVVTAGMGYGISNNPCKNCDNNQAIGGATFALSLGYKFSEKFRLDFGPSFWIEGKDMVNSNVTDNQKPDNKRTLVTFTGTWLPFKKTPLSFRLGAGAGTLNYTPEKKSVKYDEQKYDDTEIFKGLAGQFGINYELTICSKIKIYPAVNFWYIHFENPKIDYNSYINYRRDSFTGDVRVNFNFSF